MHTLNRHVPDIVSMGDAAALTANSAASTTAMSAESAAAKSSGFTPSLQTRI
jgi:hypothetical protein